jgi:chromosome segregation ATPase
MLVYANNKLKSSEAAIADLKTTLAKITEDHERAIAQLNLEYAERISELEGAAKNREAGLSAEQQRVGEVEKSLRAELEALKIRHAQELSALEQKSRHEMLSRLAELEEARHAEIDSLSHRLAAKESEVKGLDEKRLELFFAKDKADRLMAVQQEEIAELTAKLESFQEWEHQKADFEVCCIVLCYGIVMIV